MPEVNSIAEALAEPFEPREIKFKPQSVKNNRCLAMPYIDARLVQDRLDDVVGVENWCDRYTVLPDGSVLCTLKVRFGDRWIAKSDVGSPSEQPDGGDRLKAAFSDALKRAAVKFGIGRYLYRLPAQWVDYDGVKKQIVSPPQLPAWALPKPKAGAQSQRPAPQPAPKPAQQPQPAPQPAPAPKAGGEMPANGEELLARLRAYDAKLSGAGRCKQNQLVNHVVQAGVKAGFAADLSAWTGPAIPFAVDAAKEFEKALPKVQPHIPGTEDKPRAKLPD